MPNGTRAQTPTVSGDVVDDVTVVELAGSFDHDPDGALSTAIGEAVAAGCALVIDLAEVTFISARVLGTVLYAVQRFESERIAVAVVLPRGDARQLFESAHLSRTLPAHHSVDEAVRAVRA
jgi:anti-anti-sigma factor